MTIMRQLLSIEKINLLLVDDEVEVLKALRRVFRNKKYQVFTAESGADGLDILEQYPIDVVISDVRMPKMSGADFLTQVYQRWPQTKRLVLTGHADIEDTLRLVNDCDLFRYFHKPWHKDDIKNAVEQAAEQKRLTEENQQLQAITQEQNQKLITLNEQLDQHLQTRTEQLNVTTERLNDELKVEQELRQARIAADKANEAKSRFLATMSHEIRSPLNSIIVMNNLLMESGLDEEQQQHAKLAHQAGQLLLSLVNDILDFSKIESGELSLDPQWFNMAALAKSTADILSTQAELKNIRLNCNIDSNVQGLFKGDQVRIKQILINVLSNAVKFTEHGYVALNVFREEPTDNLVLQIEDSGIGIDADQQDRIFNEFVQVEDNANRRFGGTGLGLSIVKRLVMKMGGAIKLLSTPNLGSTFIITLPLDYKAITHSPKVAQPIDPTIKQDTARWRGVDLLLVEDSPANVAVIQALLKKYAFKIDVAHDGEQAINKAQSKQYQAILMDLSMPKMDGIAATEWLRANDNINQHTPIIAMTANAFVEDKIRCFQAGMNDYLSKPINIDAFLASLTKWLADAVANDEQSQITPNAARSVKKSDNTHSQSHSNTESNNADATSVSKNNSTQSSKQTPPVKLIDQQVIDGLIRDIGLDTVPTILNIYQTETTDRLQKMLEALANNDWSTLSAEAHALKSSSGSFGLCQLQQNARYIELAKTDEERRHASHLVRELAPLYQTSVSALQSYLQQCQ
ncbi:hypothetical protein C2869_02485 [Saccharobesus litoralis]|uniref:histidine kinase n=1 Tax=Saccharobesus litoralis TaxID=2172099 RepID=A0A2S0VME9_9ALTE|nr:response regulator [Saccharobesus litoralis]AWB65375.1 hypothetical protein C2869_02485 [Saccharobesus litoralis]